MFFSKKLQTALAIPLFAVGICIASPALAVTKSYIGPDGGTWETPSNWSPAGVPSSADDVFVTGTVSRDVIVSAGQQANFANLTVATSSLSLFGDIGSGGNITLEAFGYLVQKNTSTQTITGNFTIKAASSLTVVYPYAVNFVANNFDVQGGGYVEGSYGGYMGGAPGTNGNGPGAGAS